VKSHWDNEADVVVVGYGLSGAVAAIEAHDQGAKVIIIEKSQYPGGLSILSGGVMICTNNLESTIEYLTATSGGRVDSELIHTFAQGLVGNEEYLRKLGTINNAKLQLEARREPHGYPFKGRDAFYQVRFQEIPGFNGFPWVQHMHKSGVRLMKVIFDNVEKRQIKVMLSLPATRLITDSENNVIGIMARDGTREVSFKARKAIILACGGFEQNPSLQNQYLQGKPFYSVAPLTHTGDGILMAQKVGAALWHMWHLHGSYGFKFPEVSIAFRNALAGSRNSKHIVPWIVVDKFGSRYMNECPPAPSDTPHRAMELFDADIPGYPRIPSYMVLDGVGITRGPIAHPIAIGGIVYDWSKDNVKEIDKGWIIKGTTVQELAIKIKQTSEDEGFMEASILESTIAQWNDIVKKGKDPLHRPPGTMIPIEQPPYYAIPMWPTISNTQGGPQHNAKQQVIDPFGQPIPHLYAVGELGSFWGHLYLLDGNLAECLLSGRIAGINAAKETEN